MWLAVLWKTDGGKETSEKAVAVSLGASSRDGNKVGVEIPFGCSNPCNLALCYFTWKRGFCSDA